MTLPPPGSSPTRAAKKVLDQLLAVEPGEVPDLIDRLCSDDSALRQEVEWLLSHEKSLAGFLENPVLRLPVEAWRDPDEGPVIPSYRLIRRIGQGGMGTVYLAERVEVDFVQQVALKILRRDLDGEGRDFFRTERQILARLEHPNIARLIDAGFTDDERPYIAMEYADGDVVTDYADRQRLSVRQRVQLFITICETVQFAHQNLVLHRDLKPSNIIVTNEGVPKLLDFGIARMLGSPRGDTRHPTSGALTPDYSSPEQLRGEVLSACSDVYSLGALLYRLLTARPPFDRRGLPPEELARQLEREVATPPSRAVLTTNLRADSGRLRGDLDTIVQTALAFDPADRYVSAAALAGDLKRFLRHLPIEARAPSRRYSASKFLRRNRATSALAGALCVALCTFGVVSFSLANRLRHERDSAMREQVKANRVKSLLVDAMRSANPMGSGAVTETVEQVIDNLETRLRFELAEEPAVRADLLHTLGLTNAGLGRGDAALRLLDEALGLRRELTGEEHPEYAATLREIATVWTERGDYEGAREKLERALEILVSLPEAEERDIARCWISLAWVANKEGRLEEGREAARAALALSEGWGEDGVTAEAWDVLGSVARQEGDAEEAEKYLRQGLRIRRQALGELHPSVAASLNNLAQIYSQSGRYQTAEAQYREALALRRRALAEGHPHIILSMANLGNLLHLSGQLVEAGTILEEALGLAEDALGNSHIFTALCRNNLAALMGDRGEFARAEALGRENVEALIRITGADSFWVSIARGNVAWSLIEQGRFREGEGLMREVLSELTTSRGADSAEVTQVRNNLGAIDLRQGKLEKAVLELERVLERRRKLHPEGHPDTARTLTYLAYARVMLGELESARAAAESALAVYSETLAPADWRISETRAALGAALGGLGLAKEGSELLAEAAEKLAGTRGEAAFETRWARHELLSLATDS